MDQKGSHTWNRNLYYHRCPACGFIFENRDEFEYRLGKYQKDLECPRCNQTFTLTKVTKPMAGPFFGEGDQAEVTWGQP